jgi:hypothetical protein
MKILINDVKKMELKCFLTHKHTDITKIFVLNFLIMSLIHEAINLNVKLIYSSSFSEFLTTILQVDSQQLPSNP